jgi:hypothetical protein
MFLISKKIKGGFWDDFAVYVTVCTPNVFVFRASRIVSKETLKLFFSQRLFLLFSYLSIFPI